MTVRIEREEHRYYCRAAIRDRKRPAFVGLLLNALLVPALLLVAGCDSKSFSPAPPLQSAGKTTGPETPFPMREARIAYVFSDDIVLYSEPCPTINPGCIPFSEELITGNPVHAYDVDPVSGMTTSVGFSGDALPGNTLSVAVSPTDDFLYVLSGDQHVYTFSIGYLTISEAEFKRSGLSPLVLYNALAVDGYLPKTVSSAQEAVSRIVGLLEAPEFYDRILSNTPALIQPAELLRLKAETDSLRSASFSSLTYEQQKMVVLLNRLIVELVYPDSTPKNWGRSSLHSLGTPIVTPEVSSYSSIETDPLGKYLYVVGLSELAVYRIDQNSGLLTQVTVQSISLGQLLLARSGKFAYGSTNGSLQAYSIDRNTGLLSSVGDAISFGSWVVGSDFHSYKPPAHPWQKPPFRNMAADEIGKYLFVIGQQVTTYIRYAYPSCSIPDDNSDGSLIYTYLIDSATGELTQSGPPFSTAPHTVTWGSIDPLGRSIELLHTHELIPNYYDGCGPGVIAFNPGYVYSYSIDQATGAINPSGSVAAGGRELPTGFVNAGMNSVSVTPDPTGTFLYLLNPYDLYAYAVDPADGAVTPIGSPLSGAAVTPMPLVYTINPPDQPLEPILWPAKCYVKEKCETPETCCSVTGSRSHSLNWAGY